MTQRRWPGNSTWYNGFRQLLRTEQDCGRSRKERRLDYIEAGSNNQMIDGVIIKVRAFGFADFCISLQAMGPGLGLNHTWRVVALTRCDASSRLRQRTIHSHSKESAALALTMCDMAPDHPIT